MKCAFYSRGFTLIELLVVIAIIGILSSIVLASLNSARVKARDTKRIIDLEQIADALEMYYLDHGTYPNPHPTNNILCHSHGCGTIWAYSAPDGPDYWANLEADLAPYMRELPRDPVNNEAYPDVTGNYSYGYKYHIDRNVYALIAQFEGINNPLRCEVKGWAFQVDLFRPGTFAWCNGTHGAAVHPFPASPWVYDASPRARQAD